MIAIVCRCSPRPGLVAESQAAALELAAGAHSHEGLIGYFWNTDEATSDLHVVEMFQDEASVFNHIAESDLSGFLAASEFREIKVYGEPPSPKLREVLSNICDLTVYPML